MKLSTWAEIIGVIAVVLSLLFVAYELRQNSTITAFEAAQNLAEMGQDLSIIKMEPGMASIIDRANRDVSELTSLERQQFFEMVRSDFNLWEHAYFSHKQGVLPDEMWAIWNASYCNEVPLTWYEEFLGFDPKQSFLPEFMEIQRACYENRKLTPAT